MFVRIVKERKRREIDPTNDAIREVLSKLPDSDMDEKVQTLRARLQALLEIFDLIDAAYKQVFINDISLEELSTLVRGTVDL